MRHLDLFAGIGGFSLAAQWMGWETIAQVEWDEWCQKVLAKNFPDALRFGDIVEFNKMLENGEITADTISQPTGCKCGTACDKERRTDEDRGESIRQGDRETCTGGLDATDTGNGIHIGHIDIITGGFPCQPFSHAGKRKGTDDSRYLWPAMLETIRRFKPAYVVGENVAGLVSMENGKTLDRILSDLEDEGYTTEQVIIPACAVGAWHRRDRIWIIGYRTMSDTKCGQQGQDRCCVGLNGEGRASLQAENEGWEGETIQHRELDDVQGDDPHSRLLGSEVYEQQAAGVVECGEDAADINNQRLQGRSETGDTSGGGEKRNEQPKRCDQFLGGQDWQPQPLLGGMVDGLPAFMDGYWDREPEGVPRVATGVKDRVNRLKGLGNAIVPQVAYQIFKAIEQYEINR